MTTPKDSLTIDTHHHILPDFFWRETENAHAPVGGLAPLRRSKEASISFMDDAGIETDFPYLRRALAVSSKQRISQRPSREGTLVAIPADFGIKMIPQDYYS